MSHTKNVRSQMVRIPDPVDKHVILSSRLFSSVHERCLVDEYKRGTDRVYRLTSTSVDLTTYLHGRGFRMTFLPGVSFSLLSNKRKGDRGHVFECKPDSRSTVFEFDFDGGSYWVSIQ